MGEADMSAELVVRICGGYHILCAIFHVLFPRLLNWEKDLLSLRPENRASMQILNLCLVLFWAMFGYLYLFHSPEVVSTRLGKSMLICMAVFWTIRIIYIQPKFMGLQSRASWAMIVFFLVGLVLNIVPLVACYE
jgi:hypothetical protein